MAPLSDDDIRRLDDRYVRQEHCDTVHKDSDAKIVSLTVAYTETKTQFKMLMAMLGAIGSIVAGILIKMLIGG